MFLTKYEERKIIGHRHLLLGYRGSIAHDTYINPRTYEIGTDDVDLIGVVLYPRSFYCGLNRIKDTSEVMVGKLDIVNYEIKKYMKLICKQNPNILSLLWLPENLYLKKSEEGQLLVDNRREFLSKQCYHTFCGYASDQLKKMKKEKKFSYMGERRKQLLKKFGYDVKNAECCIRLLRMGIECLQKGEINVRREDRQNYIDIKSGKWSLERVKREADKLFRRSKEALTESTLPENIDTNYVNKLLVGILKRNICVM